MNTTKNLYTIHMKELIRKPTQGNYFTKHNIIMKCYLMSHTQENVQAVINVSVSRTVEIVRTEKQAKMSFPSTVCS